MQPWFIPMFYVSGAVLAGLALPRIRAGLTSPSYALDMSVSSAQAYLSAAASGMMALTGIVFAMAFVMVQFSAIAYSPRLVLWFARDRMMFHALGAVHGDVHLRAVHAGLGGPRRDGAGSLRFAGCSSGS